MVWRNDNPQKNWIGHIATVVNVKRDAKGNVIEISIIQGHTGGNRTAVNIIDSQTELNSYQGTFLGFGEIGKDSLENFPENSVAQGGNKNK